MSNTTHSIRNFSIFDTVRFQLRGVDWHLPDWVKSFELNSNAGKPDIVFKSLNDVTQSPVHFIQMNRYGYTDSGIVFYHVLLLSI